ncbi:hypothetical protein AB6813_09485 [bacterium RCC_150]
MKHLITALVAVLLLAFGGIATVSAVQSSHNTSAWDGGHNSSSRPSASPSVSSSPTRTSTPSAAPTATTAPSPVAAPSTQAAPAPVAAAPTSSAPVTAAAATAPATGTYPLHTNIVSTTFWVGEIFNASLSDGSQVCSTFNGQWAFQHTGVNLGTTPSSASGCPGSPYGGCDGVSSGSGSTFKCATEPRVASNGYFPQHQAKPLQNPFYLDLPYDDVNDSVAFAERCKVIPWAAADNAATGVNHCADSSYSYMKNAWVQITGPNGNVCYGQVEDAGPSSGSLYHDSAYVFGSTNARPANKQFSGDPSQGAGMDVSPALNGCLGFADLDGDNDHVSWRFVDRASVPAGPWLTVVTTAGVTN